MPRQLSTLQKAKKILSYSQNLQATKHSAIQKTPAQQSSDKQSFSSALKDQSKLEKEFCLSKSKSKNRSNDSQSNKKLSKSSRFVSTYGKQTRFDKIMKLKVKPAFQARTQKGNYKQSISSKSESSSQSSQKIKQNSSRNKMSRLEKIMQIKVTKPIISSTFAYPEFRHSRKSSTQLRKERMTSQQKQYRLKIQKSVIYQEKEERLWKVTERERQLKYKLKKDAQRRQFQEQQRKELRFQNMLCKQLMNLQSQRQIVKRKSECFSNYIYPFH